MSFCTPQFTLQDYEQHFADRHLLHAVVEKFARETPAAAALIDAATGRRVSWAEFDHATRSLAAVLHTRGLRRGDYFASLLPLTCEHVFLEYACFRIGVIFVPLDLRLGAAELARSLGIIRPAGVAFVKAPAIADADTFCEGLHREFSPRLLVQFAAPEECAEASVAMAALLQEASQAAVQALADAEAITSQIKEADGALVIFTTGSTGSPKAALLSHRSITCQNMCLSRGLLHGSPTGLVTLVNLPPSHVGCQTELLMSTLFDGGTAVLVPIFDPARSLAAIAGYKVTAIGQIPAMFQFEWRLKDYAAFDLSSLDFAAYGGQGVPPAFLERMAQMSPNVGTGLGLTETSGFCTYIRRPLARAAECSASLGTSMPVYPLSIRSEMQASGAAGEEVAPGELGYVCFRGPQTFLGYVRDEAATRAALSSDGYLYTGDMGRVDASGALHMAGRAKHIIKPAGYQVFPGDVENHFSLLDGVASCAVVGVEHPITSEAIIAFIEPQPGRTLTLAELHRHARELAVYMRPYHYVLLEPGQMPLNRVAKADYLVLRERARQDMVKLDGEFPR